jgi:natural product biosynthesis luciferase-like monooxygenase protein
MDFGIMFFSGVPPDSARNRYRLVTEAARFADGQGFCSVWVPERHFHPFGGLFPNPSVLAAALAMVTSRLQIRAGSLVSPLHDTLRIAEDWSVVDNLSGGRAAISFGSGWNIDDFVFYPERYKQRQAMMYRQIEDVRALWRGEALTRPNGGGHEVRIEIYPRPVQPELPVWITSSGNVQTFVSAGAVGANLLCHLLGQTVGQLGEKIARYRAAREERGFEGRGKVALMLHTFFGTDREAVRARVRPPFREYLRSAISLEQMAAMGGGAISGGHRIDPHSISPQVMEDLLDIAFERYFHTAALMGTPESCRGLLSDLEEAEVDEIACLIDFIDDDNAVLESLNLVAKLRNSLATAKARTSVLGGFLDDLQA